MPAGLVATVVSPDEASSLAVFEDNAKKEDFSYHIGEKVLDDDVVVSIDWRRVVVRRGSKCEFFSL